MDVNPDGPSGDEVGGVGVILQGVEVEGWEDSAGGGLGLFRFLGRLGGLGERLGEAG